MKNVLKGFFSSLTVFIRFWLKGRWSLIDYRKHWQMGKGLLNQIEFSDILKTLAFDIIKILELFTKLFNTT